MIDKERLLLVDPDDVSELGAGPALVPAAIRSIPIGDGGATHFSVRDLKTGTGVGHASVIRALIKLAIDVLYKGDSSCVLDRKKDKELHEHLTDPKRITPPSHHPLTIGLTDAADA